MCERSQSGGEAVKRITVVVPNSSGLHARPARVFVNAAKKFKSTIHVQHGDKKANAKSMISLLTLGVEQGAEIHITAEGEDEDVAVAELAALVSSGMGEHDAPAAPAASPTTPEPASQTPPPPAPAHAP
ncbi:MAG: HPr family phosphocarrier protein, partial [Ardenticatenia bacterium]